MDRIDTREGAIEIDHQGGDITWRLVLDNRAVDIRLTIVEASQLSSQLSKHISMAAVEKLREAPSRRR